MPKFAAWFLTLAVTLVYGVMVAVSPSGAMVYTHDCAEPVHVGCPGEHAELFIAHGHEGATPCDEGTTCRVEQSGEQTVPVPVRAPEMVAVLVCVLELKDGRLLLAERGRGEGFEGDLPGELEAMRSTCLLI